MSVTREFRRSDGVTVITESGVGDGPCFVLVHGIGMGHRYFSGLADALARSGRVLALDLPGFGDSPEPEHPLSMSGSGEHLAALLEAEDLHDVVLVGHSMGSQVVTEAAARHPERVGHVVLIAPTVNPRERSGAMQALRLMQDESVLHPKVVRLAVHSYVQAGPRWYFKKLGQMLEHHIEHTLPAVAQPTLVVRGEHDRIAPRGWAQQVARTLPRGRYVEVPDRGHETMVTAGDQVAKLVAAHARDEPVGIEIRTPAEPEPPSRLARGWWVASDYTYAIVRQLSLLAPPWTLRRERPAPRAWARGSADLPEIVLLPGVYEHWTFMRPLGNALNAGGYRVRVVHGLGANRRGIAETADRLASALERTPPPAAGRVFVAHSKGGLIGKHVLVSSGAAAAAVVEAATGGADAEPGAAAAAASGPADAAPLGVLGMVTVCTPFAGARRARFLVDPSVRAFLPSDETIVLLGRETSVNGRIVSVFGRYDPHIPDGSSLEGATNVRVPVAGHFRILSAPETWRAVFDGVKLLTAR